MTLADNYYVAVPSSGTYFAGDAISDVMYPRMKVGWGVDGSYADVSNSNPLPTEMVGGTPFKNLDVDESEDDVVSGSGRMTSLCLHNLHASNTYYVKIYDGIASGVTVGTTVAKWTIPLKAGEKFVWANPKGMAFSTGLCIAAETGLLDDGAPGAVAGANEVVAWGVYQQ